jgi:hypothetical protein
LLKIARASNLPLPLPAPSSPLAGTTAGDRNIFATTVWITSASLLNPFSTIRSASGAATTIAQRRQARFSGLVTRTK